MPATDPAAADVAIAHQATPDEPQEPKVPLPFLLSLLLTGALALLLCRPYGETLFLAATLAVTLHPSYRWLTKTLRNRPSLAAALCTLGLLAAGVAPLVGLATYSAGAIHDAVEWSKDHLHEQHLRDLREGKLPQPLRAPMAATMERLHLGVDDLEQWGSQAIEVLQRFSPQVAMASLSALTSTLFVLFAFYFFLKDGPTLVRHVHALSPLKRAHTATLFTDFRSVASASLLGMVFTATGQSVALALGYWLAGLPNVFVLSMLTAMAAFVPLLGSMLAWLPIALFSGLLLGAKVCVGLIVYSFVATNIVDAGLKPMVLKGRMAMHGALTFLGIIGGISLFGPVGFIAGPMVFAFFTSFMQMYERDYKNG